jgi:hypothetical protein
MEVDLSKAKAGDTVKFRCGGQAVVYAVEKSAHKGYMRLYFDGEHTLRMYTVCGLMKADNETLLDITEVIPAPEVFDWNCARWGQAFQYHEDICIYLGKHPKTPDKQFIIYRLDDGRTEVCHINGPLTRSPEHDIKEII